MKRTLQDSKERKQFCIFILKEKMLDGTIVITQNEVGDKSLKEELRKSFLREVLETL